MNTFTLTLMEDSFICANHKSQNYSKFAYLKVGSGDCERGSSKTLMKFDLKEIKDVRNIQAVVLQLYVKNISSTSEKISISIQRNEKNFWEEYVTWEDSPCIGDEIQRFSVSKSDVNNYINIDITNLIKDWILEECTNYGVTLSCINKSGEVTFVSSRGYNSPRIKLYYS